jgi:hypothetical protein
MDTTEGATDTYRFVLGPGNSVIDAVLSNRQSMEDDGTILRVPPLPVKVLPVLRTFTIDTEDVYQGNANEPGSASDGAYTWSWNLHG